jgi:hypothetical protein
VRWWQRSEVSAAQFAGLRLVAIPAWHRGLCVASLVAWCCVFHAAAWLSQAEDRRAWAALSFVAALSTALPPRRAVKLQARVPC